MPYHFDEAEIEELSSRVAEKLLPQLIKALKDKATWLVDEMQGEYYTAAELAEMLNVSVQTIYRMKNSGQLPFSTVGKHGVRFAKQDINIARREGKI